MASKRTCPICNSKLSNLWEHIVGVHHVVDQEERKLSLALQHGRYTGALPCHQGNCAGKYKTRLDVHMARCHTDLKEEEKKIILADEKKLEVNRVLKKLQQKKNDDTSSTHELTKLKEKISKLETRLTEAMGSGSLGPEKQQCSKQNYRIGLGKPYERMTIEKITNLWLKSRLHSNASKKKVENCKQGVNHVMEFIEMMASPDTSPSVSLTYADDPIKLGGWLKHLRSNFAIPTIKTRVYHVRTFLTYVHNHSFNGVRLGARRFKFLFENLKKEQDALESELLGHHHRRSLEKAKSLLSRDQLATFRKVAKRKIPQCLEKLSKSPRDEQRMKNFVGWLAGYVFCISGHRKGVLTHMTRDEVLNPQKDKDQEDLYVIKVTEHKTSGTFGLAGIVLTKEEYTWFLKFDKIREKLSGYKSVVSSGPKYFFFNANGGEMVRLGEMVTRVFDLIQMKNVTTTIIRASISTMSERDLSKEQRERVCNAMCHGVTTSSKWYVKLPSVAEVYATRTFVEYGTQSATTKVSAESDDAFIAPHGRKATEKKHVDFSSDDEEEMSDAAESPLARAYDEDQAESNLAENSRAGACNEDEEQCDASENSQAQAGNEEDTSFLLPNRVTSRKGSVKRRKLVYPHKLIDMVQETFKEHRGNKKLMNEKLKQDTELLQLCLNQPCKVILTRHNFRGLVGKLQGEDMPVQDSEQG